MEGGRTKERQSDFSHITQLFCSRVGTGAGQLIFSFEDPWAWPLFGDKQEELISPSAWGGGSNSLIPPIRWLSEFSWPCRCMVAWAVCARSYSLLHSQHTLCMAGAGQQRSLPRSLCSKMYISIQAAVECQVLGHRYHRNAVRTWSFPAPCKLTNALPCVLQSVALNQDSVGSLFLLQPGVVRAPGSNKPLLCPAPGLVVGWCFPAEADVVQRRFGLTAEVFCTSGARSTGPSALCQDSHKWQPLSLPCGTGQGFWCNTEREV